MDCLSEQKPSSLAKNAFYVMETGAIVMNSAAEGFDAERAKEYLAI